MSSKLTYAKRIRERYRQRLRKLQIKSRNGDKEAASNIIVQMTEYNIKLKEIGYRETDDNELVPITDSWIQEQLLNETEIDRLTREFRKTQNYELLSKIVLLMKEENNG